MELLVFKATVLVSLLSFVFASERCSDVACASVVSKCLLTQACKCDIDRKSTECTCCRNCIQCLGIDYQRCCSCLGLCEPSNDLSLGREFQIGDIESPFNALFMAFNELPDSKWTTYTFPIEATLQEFARKAELDKSYAIPDAGGAGPLMKENCTVMFWNQCMSVSKCNDYCSQHGAASYRYFFDGCCECVGLTCLNYGIDESRCSKCSKLSEEDPADVTKDLYEENSIN